MSTEVVDRTVLPPAEPMGNLVDLFARPSGKGRAGLLAPSGERISIPDELYEVLRAVITAMARGQAVTVAPHNQILTTQEAAGILGVSRPTLVRLLEDGEIPYQQPGRHRRVLLRDILAYQERCRYRRQVALDELVRDSEDAGLYEATAEPRRTR